MSSQFCVMLRLLLSSSLAAGSSMNSAAALGATFSFYFYSCIWICLFCKFLVWVCVFFVITNSFCWFVDKWVIFTCSFDEIYFLSSLVLDHRWCVLWSFIWGKKSFFSPLFGFWCEFHCFVRSASVETSLVVLTYLFAIDSIVLCLHY